MGLEIAFDSRELRTTCESPARAKRLLGECASLALQRHLADMEAVESVAELLEIGAGIENFQQEQKMLRFHLIGEVYLYCEVNHHSVPMTAIAIDWSQVTRLKITRIGSNE